MDLKRIAAWLKACEVALRAAQDLHDGSERARGLYAAVRREYELAEAMARKALGLSWHLSVH